MASDNFEPCLDVTLTFEGGLSMVRSDPGNWSGGKVGKGELRGTNYGIAASAHPTLDIAKMTKAGAGVIYRADYWNRVGGDALPVGPDLAVFDAGVMSGPARALAWLATARKTAKTDLELIDGVCAARLSFVHALTTWKAFGKGWGARVATCSAKAHRMALGTSPAASATIAAKAVVAKTKAKTAKTSATATTGGAAAAPVAVHAAGGHHVFAIIAGVVVLIGVAVILFAGWRQSQLAAALTTEATKA